MIVRRLGTVSTALALATAVPTDGAFLRHAGIPVYGVTGFFQTDTFAHGMNERIPQRASFDGLEFTYRLVTRITSKVPVR